MLEIGRFLQKRRSFKWTVTRVEKHIHIYLNSILVIIIWISAKCIFDEWFVLNIEFIWSDNNSVDRVVFFVNGSADLIRIGDSRAKCILKFFAVPFLNWDERTVKWIAWTKRTAYLVRDDNHDSVSLLTIQCTTQPIGKAIHCQILKT